MSGSIPKALKAVALTAVVVSVWGCTSPAVSPTPSPAPPTSVPSSTPLPPREGLAVSTDETDLSQLVKAVRTGWIAEEARRARYQLDLRSSSWSSLKVCAFEDGYSLTYVGQTVTATIKDLQTGNLIAEGTFYEKGDFDVTCPSVYRFQETQAYEVGLRPDRIEFGAWLDLIMGPLGFEVPPVFKTPVPETTWKEGIPIMPGAILGREEDARNFNFKIDASPAEILAYYRQLMPTLGWMESTNKYEDQAIFDQGESHVNVSVRPFGGTVNDVTVFLNHR